MRRTQLYLDDHLWNALHARARSQKTTVSELVREAARDRYLGRQDEQKKAMQAFVGIRKGSDSNDAVEYVQNLRSGGRLGPAVEDVTVLVDSDILIEVSRGLNAEIVSSWIELSNAGAAVLYSPVSVAELWAGARPSEHDALHSLFGALTCTPIDSAAGQQAGAFLRKYRKSHGVEVADALIAACALANNAQLWTRNRKHYPMKEISFFD